MSIDFLNTFLENLAQNGLEHFRSFYGSYRAFVERNDDPEQRGRVQVSVPPLAPTIVDVWIDPAFNQAGPNRGTFWPPEVGDTVWVCFDRGRVDSPCVYHTGWHGEDDMPGEFEYSGPKGQENPTPARRGWVTRAGHQFIFDDTPGEEAISLIWHSPEEDLSKDLKVSADRSKGKCSTLLFRPNGNVFISSQIGQFIEMDAENGVFKIAAPAADGESAAMINMDKDGVFIFDSKGTNQIFLDKGKINIISPGDITLNGKSFNAKTGGQLLGDGASEPVVLGQTYTTARATMNTAVGTAFQTVAGVAQGLAAALAAPPFSLGLPPTGGALAPALIPYFTAVASTFLQAGIQITQFEAKGITYLSKKTKTA